MPTTTAGKLIHLLFTAITDANVRADLGKLLSDLVALLTAAGEPPAAGS